MNEAIIHMLREKDTSTISDLIDALRDMVWYVSRRTALNLRHLEARMAQSGHKNWEGPLTGQLFENLLAARIQNLDVDSARADVSRFISNQETISIWSRNFFAEVARRIIFA
jgi:hypothetical protein